MCENIKEAGVYNFQVDDIASLAKYNNIDLKRIINILEIRTVKKEDMHKGYATALFNDFIKEFENDVIITRSAAFKTDYEVEPNDEEYANCLYNQACFLVPLGFYNINSLCGFEFGTPYIYINKAAKPIITKILINEYFN